MLASTSPKWATALPHWSQSAKGVREQFGSIEADAGRGLSLRMDHDSQYRSDDLRAPLKFWGITPSYAFVAEPQTNGRRRAFQSDHEGASHPRTAVQQR
ncbi:MAG: hypothetical protein VB137_04525 [Burkholderia sp.]